MMTDAAHTTASSGPKPARRRPPQAPAARALVTGVALGATGLFVAVMGSAAPPSASVNLVSQAPQQIVVLHRSAAVGTPEALPAAPTAGRAVPAPYPTQRIVPAPAPVATSTGS